MSTGLIILSVIAIVIIALALQDILQKKHTVRRNFPLIGRLRYLLEALGPELRQYIVTSNTSERPFSRNERRLIYAFSKGDNDLYGFGTDHDIEAPNHPIILQSSFPLPAPDEGQMGGPPHWNLPCAKIIGASHNRVGAFRPSSVVNISGMSYGALSAPAVEALSQGARIAGCMQNTGEGGISAFHRAGGADLIAQLGTGYFGARDKNGHFSMTQLLKTLERAPQTKAIEIKLSQGAKPGLGGVLPGAKVTAEIAAARGVPEGESCKSPNNHTAFNGVDGMCQFIEEVAAATGRPVGIKSAVGDMVFWRHLATWMQANPGKGPDFITIDGGEGGTGAAPLVYSDNVSLAFMVGFPRVYRLFAEAGLAQDIVWIGSGRLGLPGRAIWAMALGCDMINVGREAMLSIGCIQAQRCHTNHCPTGVATHNNWLVRGLDPTLKGARCANYIMKLRRELLSVARTCGVEHPALIGPQRLEIMQEHLQSVSAADAFSYPANLIQLSPEQIADLAEQMRTLPKVAND